MFWKYFSEERMENLGFVWDRPNEGLSSATENIQR